MNILLFLIIFILVLLVVYMKRTKRVHIRGDKGFIDKGVLSKRECEELIEMAKRQKFETKNDEVDESPEQQIDILARGQVNQELWEKCRKIFIKNLKPIVNSTPWIPNDQRINYIFLRRYRRDERTHIPMHTDDNYLTMSFLLSDTKDFEGGEIYIFDSKTSKEIDDWDDKFYEETSNRENYINSHTDLPIVDYQQGDLAVYTGGSNYHGTLPVKNGERYILTFFFDKSMFT